MTIFDRRSLARGAAWAVPTLAVATAAPAYALSCPGIVLGSPLPISAFQATYLLITNETFGGALNKQVGLDFGFRVTAAAAACIGGAPKITGSAPKEAPSSFSLSNDTTYTGSNGVTLPANGTVGVTDTGCQNGLAGTQACGTTSGSAFSVAGSTYTSNYSVLQAVIRVNVTVAGYGTTVFNLEGSNITASGGFPHAAATLALTSV